MSVRFINFNIEERSKTMQDITVTPSLIFLIVVALTINIPAAAAFIKAMEILNVP